MLQNSSINEEIPSFLKLSQLHRKRGLSISQSFLSVTQLPISTKTTYPHTAWRIAPPESISASGHFWIKGYIFTAGAQLCSVCTVQMTSKSIEKVRCHNFAHGRLYVILAERRGKLSPIWYSVWYMAWRYKRCGRLDQLNLNLASVNKCQTNSNCSHFELLSWPSKSPKISGKRTKTK